jgi:hypothetical protein
MFVSQNNLRAFAVWRWISHEASFAKIKNRPGNVVNEEGISIPYSRDERANIGKLQ